jgi:hypothetical protein
MTTQKFCHEKSPLHAEAREMFRVVVALSRSNPAWSSRDGRRHAVRLLEHATSAGDAPSIALRNLSLRYAKLSALKLCASVEAAEVEQQLSDADRALARAQLSRVLAELGAALPSSAAGPAASPPTTPEDAAPGATAASGGGNENGVDHDRSQRLTASVMPRLEAVEAAGTS